jgi:hypothetical protein
LKVGVGGVGDSQASSQSKRPNAPCVREDVPKHTCVRLYGCFGACFSFAVRRMYGICEFGLP